MHHKEHHAEHHHIAQNHQNSGVVLHHRVVDRNTFVMERPTKGHNVQIFGAACVEGFLLCGRLGLFFFGEVNDPVVLDLHFGQIVAVHSGEQIRKSGFGVLSLTDGVVYGADQQHHGHGDNQRDPYIYLWPLVCLFGIVWGFLVWFHVGMPPGLVFLIISHFFTYRNE